MGFRDAIARSEGTIRHHRNNTTDQPVETVREFVAQHSSKRTAVQSDAVDI